MLTRDDHDRDDLSPMMSQDARGRPSFITSATTPIYVYTSAKTTCDASILATHNLLRVEYNAGSRKAQTLNRSEPV